MECAHFDMENVLSEMTQGEANAFGEFLSHSLHFGQRDLDKLLQRHAIC